MKQAPPPYVEKHRVKSGPLASDSTFGCTGAFLVPLGSATLKIISSDGSGWRMVGEPWEHVSVSTPYRTPTWAEMDQVKR